jgi:hypothetical protein
MSTLRTAVAIAIALTVVGTTAAQTPPPRPELGPGQASNWSAPPGAPEVAGLVTENLSATLSPADLAATIIGNGVLIQNVVFSGMDVAAGRFQGGTGIIGFESGIVLSSGNVNSIVGPNTFDDTSTVNPTGSDPDLAGLIPGYTVFDHCHLEFDFSCQLTQVITFQFVFSSEEYNEYVNSPFNDVFGFFVNGQNIAIVPGTASTPVSINNVNCNNPYSPPSGSHCGQFVNNDLSDGSGAINTEMDGLTLVFSATVAVSPGFNHIKLSIGDAGDSVLDSNVFIRAGSLVCGNPGPVCEAPMPAIELGAGPQAADIGVPFSHPIRAIATNGLPGQQVTVTGVSASKNGVPAAMPPGASITPALPVMGQPALATFDWTPGNRDSGTWVFVYSLVDQLGATGFGTVQLNVSPGGDDDVECFLLASPFPASISLGGGDFLLLDFFQAFAIVVTETDIPDIEIPDIPAYVGIDFYFQVGLYNPTLYPEDPIKTSNGLHIVVGTSTIQAYGPASGITLWSTTPPLLDTDFLVEFVIW